MDYTHEEKLFIEFLNSFNSFYKSSYEIAKSKEGVSILPEDNDFKMFSLDEMAQNSPIFRENGITFVPKTSDALWYKKENGNFYIFLIEFKGDFLFKTSGKCSLVQVIENLKYKNYNDELSEEIKRLDKITSKFSDKMLNGLAAKPLETVTIALPLIYEDYCLHNDVEYFDIRNFLKSSRIVYRVVSISKDCEANRLKSRSRSYRSSNLIPSICRKLARERHDRQIDASYESSLETYHRRYERAGIVYSAGFVDNIAFKNFTDTYLR